MPSAFESGDRRGKCCCGRLAGAPDQQAAQLGLRGLCFLCLRNVKGFKWNHKRVYRIDRELELNLRIKPRHRLVREKPLPLPSAVPAQINDTWSMDFMHDHSSMLMSSAITARCATTGWPITSLKRSRRSRTLQPAGCGLAITPGPTWHLAAPHQNRSLPWPLKLYL
jgi:hypothetical protein